MTRKLHETQTLASLTFTGTRPRAFTSMLPVAASVLTGRSELLQHKPYGPQSWTYLPTGPLQEGCQPLVYANLTC